MCRAYPLGSRSMRKNGVFEHLCYPGVTLRQQNVVRRPRKVKRIQRGSGDEGTRLVISCSGQCGECEEVSGSVGELRATELVEVFGANRLDIPDQRRSRMKPRAC